MSSAPAVKVNGRGGPSLKSRRGTPCVRGDLVATVLSYSVCYDDYDRVRIPGFSVSLPGEPTMTYSHWKCRYLKFSNI